MARGRKNDPSGMSGRSYTVDLGCRLQVSTVERVNARQPRVIETAGSTGRSLTENTSFGGFSAGPCRQDHPVSLGGIVDYDGLAAMLAGFEFTGLPTCSIAGKSPGVASCLCCCSMSIHCCEMGTASGGKHQQDLSLFPQLPLSHHSKKLSLN